MLLQMKKKEGGSLSKLSQRVGASAHCRDWFSFPCNLRERLLSAFRSLPKRLGFPERGALIGLVLRFTSTVHAQQRTDISQLQA
ncbi:hypothetical protein D9M71_681230 [compost metagenome]